MHMSTGPGLLLAAPICLATKEAVTTVVELEFYTPMVDPLKGMPRESSFPLTPPISPSTPLPATCLPAKPPAQFSSYLQAWSKYMQLARQKLLSNLGISRADTQLHTAGVCPVYPSLFLCLVILPLHMQRMKFDSIVELLQRQNPTLSDPMHTKHSVVRSLWDAYSSDGECSLHVWCRMMPSRHDSMTDSLVRPMQRDSRQDHLIQSFRPGAQGAPSLSLRPGGAAIGALLRRSGLIPNST